MGKKNILYLSAIIIFAAGLRILALTTQGSFWFDEIFTVYFAGLDLPEMFSFIIYDHNPPVHFLLIHYWLKLFGSNEIIVRLSSLIFGLANIGLIYLVGQQLFSKRIGQLAGFLGAISLFQIYYSVEARMYSLLLFLTLLSFYFFWRLLNQYKFKNLILYLGFTVLALLTHLTGLFVLLIQNAFVLYLYFQKELKLNFKKWFFGQLAVVIVFGIWFGPMVYLKLQEGLNILQGWYFTQTTRHFFLENLNNFFIFGRYQEFINLILQIIILGLLILAVIRISRPDKRFIVDFDRSGQIILLLLWLFLPLAVGFIFNVNVTKYYIIASPALYLLAAKGLDNLKLTKKYLALFLIIVFLLIWPLAPHNVTAAWPEVIQYIEDQSTDNSKVIANPFILTLPLKFYDLQGVTLEGFYPVDDEPNLDLRIVKKNWFPQITEDNAEKLQQATYNFDRILLVTFYVDQSRQDDFVKKWFLKNGWQITDERLFPADVGVITLIRSQTVNSRSSAYFF
ncbi:MAG TPA: glycosyltransferase family 39 protein [Patescibacteria group bacterium]